MAKKWWETLFNDIYLSAFVPFYTNSQTKQEVKFVKDYFDPKRKILDMACGNGRHSLQLAKEGFNVVGVDYSKVLIDEAQKNAKESGLEIKFIKGDMRNPKVAQKFDGAIILGDSFGYFSDQDNEKVIKGMAKIIKKSGYLIIDLPNTPGILRNVRERSKRKLPNGHMVAQHFFFDPETFILTTRWEVVVNKKREEYEGTMRLYTLPEIKALLERNKFGLKEVYGSFDKEWYSINSPRTIIVAQKK